MKVYARVGAKVIIENKLGRILVLRRSANMSRPGGWDFPGGASDFGEAMENTVIRETREETGLEIFDLKLAVSHSSISEDNDYTVLTGFIAKTQSAQVTISHEHDFVEWITPNEATRLSKISFLEINFKYS